MNYHILDLLQTFSDDILNHNINSIVLSKDDVKNLFNEIEYLIDRVKYLEKKKEFIN